MKQAKGSVNEPVEKRNVKQNAAQSTTKAETDKKPSWAAYYLIIAMAVGAILIVLKVVGVL